jgi:cyclopropane-fatty-acyl-phospholipid synthase
MKDSIASPAPRLHFLRRPGWRDRVARRIVDRLLGQLAHGRLTVTGPFGTQTFGRSPDLTAGGTLAAARSNVRGEWTADDLTAACRIFARNMDVATRMDGGWARLSAPWLRLAQWALRNTRTGSRRNIEAHYDLGNDFFGLFLDETMSYSCALFERDGMALAEASRTKIDRICRTLALGPDDHLLEIGTGWGELAIRAASRYGCRVTTTTISREQYDLARERVRAAGVADRVTVLRADYRDLTGTFDAIVSVEMIEAVGAEYLDTFFAECRRHLAPGGRMLVQAITVPDERYDDYLQSVDFIQQDVFPGSCLVSTGAMRAAAGRAGLAFDAVDDFTPHYARTLRHWRRRFLERLDDVRQLGYSDEFIRRWELYLCSCEAGFAERTTGLVQAVFSRPGETHREAA